MDLPRGRIQYKRPYGTVPPAWVAKSASCSTWMTPYKMQNLVNEWVNFQRCKQVIFCKSKSSPKSLIASPKSSPKLMLGVASQVTTYSQVKSQPCVSHVKSLVFGSSQVKSHTFTACFLNFANTFFVCGFLQGNLIILFGLNVFF